VTISENPIVQAHYERCLSEGTSESLARMFAFGQAPNAFSDTAFFNNRDDGFGKDNFARQNALTEAKTAGVSVSGATYMPGLATYPGDPRAWVRSKGEIAKRCNEMGLHAEGPGFRVDGQMYARPKPEAVPVAPDIVADAVERRLLSEPGMPTKDIVEETREMITPKYGKPAPFKLVRSE